ncbi:MAG TPA: hypothetical protein VGD64_05970 [Acidisarcina sp.]
MTAKSAFVWRDALRLLSVRLVLEQLGLVLGVFVLFVVWLRLPDVSALEVAGSGLFAMLIVAAAGLGETRIVLSIAGRASTWGRLLRGASLLVVAAVIWFAWNHWLTHLSGPDATRAGYFNSRAPHQLRYLLTYGHILLWLGWMWSTLGWIGAGVITVFAFALTASTRPMRAALLALRSLSFWLVLLIGSTAGVLVTGVLMGWTPLHGLRLELLSLGCRVAIASLFDATIACWLLSILAACVRRADASYSKVDGGPDESQPRTVGNP